MGRTVRAGDVELFVEEVGPKDAPATLLMHGGLGLDHTYLREFDRLTPDRRVIYYDHRSNGRSPVAPLEGVTMLDLATDAAALCGALDLGPVDVIGHSYGGFVALEMALRHPETVRSLVLLDTLPGLTPEVGEQRMEQVAARSPEPEVIAVLNASEPPASAEAARQMLSTLLPLYVHRLDLASLTALLDGVRVSLDGMAVGDAAASAWDVTEDLGRISAPTLVLCGRHDWICPLPQSVLMADRIPGARLVVFEDSGHFPWLEEPAEFWRALDDFLAAP